MLCQLLPHQRRSFEDCKVVFDALFDARTVNIYIGDDGLRACSLCDGPETVVTSILVRWYSILESFFDLSIFILEGAAI